MHDDKSELRQIKSQGYLIGLIIGLLLGNPVAGVAFGLTIGAGIGLTFMLGLRDHS